MVTRASKKRLGAVLEVEVRRSARRSDNTARARAIAIARFAYPYRQATVLKAVLFFYYYRPRQGNPDVVTSD